MGSPLTDELRARVQLDPEDLPALIHLGARTMAELERLQEDLEWLEKSYKERMVRLLEEVKLVTQPLNGADPVDLAAAFVRLAEDLPEAEFTDICRHFGFSGSQDQNAPS